MMTPGGKEKEVALSEVSEDDDEEDEPDFDSTTPINTPPGNEKEAASASDEVSDEEDEPDFDSTTLINTPPVIVMNTGNEKEAGASDEDDDEEDDPDFDPTAPINTPPENVSEDESDGDDDNQADLDGNFPSRRSRKRLSTVSIEELADNNNKAKQLKLVSVNSSQELHLPPGIPKTRITFLSGKASDIGLGGVFKKGTGMGLSAVLAALQCKKQNKLTTLEKSRLDWQSFKKAEGLDDELKNRLKSRNGYLEKQDFLERTDHRQFELEKSMRAKVRRNPLGS